MDDLRNEIHELAKLMKIHMQQSQRKNNSNPMTIKWWQTLIGVAAVVISVGINWGVSTTRLSNVETQIEDFKESISKVETDLLELKLKQARDDQLLVTIEKTLKEVKEDVKKLADK